MREIVFGGTGTISYEIIPLWLACTLCLVLVFSAQIIRKINPFGCYTHENKLKCKVQSCHKPENNEAVCGNTVSICFRPLYIN